MPDDIYRDARGVNMAHTEDVKPWWGTGQIILPTDTVDDIAAKAGFDWHAIKCDVMYDYGDPTGTHLLTMPSRVVLARSDTGAPLEVVSKDYEPHQPMDILNFFRKVCALLDLSIHTCGILQGGRRFWCLAKTGDNFTIGGVKWEGYILLATSLDKTLATVGKATITCVVCNNTLNAALYDSTGDTPIDAVKLTHRSQFNADLMAERMGLVSPGESLSLMAAQLDALSEHKLTQGLYHEDHAAEFYTNLIRPNIDPDKPAPKRTPRGLDSLMDAYRNAPGAMPNTALGLVQGATYYIDHMRGKNWDARTTSAWFGQGAAFKQRAFDSAMQMIGGQQ